MLAGVITQDVALYLDTRLYPADVPLWLDFAKDEYYVDGVLVDPSDIMYNYDVARIGANGYMVRNYSASSNQDFPWANGLNTNTAILDKWNSLWDEGGIGFIFDYHDNRASNIEQYLIYAGGAEGLNYQFRRGASWTTGGYPFETYPAFFEHFYQYDPAPDFPSYQRASNEIRLDDQCIKSMSRNIVAAETRWNIRNNIDYYFSRGANLSVSMNGMRTGTSNPNQGVEWTWDHPVTGPGTPLPGTDDPYLTEDVLATGSAPYVATDASWTGLASASWDYGYVKFGANSLQGTGTSGYSVGDTSLYGIDIRRVIFFHAGLTELRRENELQTWSAQAE